MIKKLTEVGELPRHQEPAVLLKQIEERSGLLREVGLNMYAFTHLTFQEYYVAREIVSQGDSFKNLRRVLRDDRWQEVIRLTAGLLDEQGRKPITDFLDDLLIKPSFPARPKPSQVRKLDLLIGCLKDKVEPEAYIGDYVRKSLLALTERGQVTGLRTRLTQLGDFARTGVGMAVVDELRKRIVEGGKESVARNSVIMGYNLFERTVDRLEFLKVVLIHADEGLTILGGAALALCDDLAQTPEAVQTEFQMQIQAMPLERRKRIVQHVQVSYPGHPLNRVAEVLMRPEERSGIPPRLRQRG